MTRFTYAVGDVHGCFDLTRQAVETARRHAAGRTATLVFLGDYADRGPQTRSTVEFLIELQRGSRLICLKGNHEEMIVRYEETRTLEDWSFWIEHGGSQTLASYGGDAADPATFERIPVAHRRWMMMRPLVLQTPSHVFVHAGLDPGKDMVNQGESEFLWIRERFLRAAPDDFVERRHIVHGHSPRWAGKPRVEFPELLRHRTNLDTGAYETGLLTIGVFDCDHSGPPVDVLSIF